MPSYSVVQIPTTLGVTHDLEAENINEVREWANVNVDTTTRWIIKQDGRTIGEAIIIELWSVQGRSGQATKRTFNSAPKRAKWFPSKNLAELDYQRHKPAAEALLDEIEEKLADLQKALSFEINYHMDGDTHGIYEDYQYISVQEGGYEFFREI